MSEAHGFSPQAFQDFHLLRPERKKYTKGLGCGVVVRGQNWSGDSENMARVMEVEVG